jgi:hypothetical protein
VETGSWTRPWNSAKDLVLAFGCWKSWMLGCKELARLGLHWKDNICRFWKSIF